MQLKLKKNVDIIYCFLTFVTYCISKLCARKTEVGWPTGNFDYSPMYVLFFRNVLQKACEVGLRSIAFCVINSVRRNYPPDEGAHIALRKKIYLYFAIFA